MTTRSMPASSIMGSARPMVNGSGNCGLAPGSQAQSGEFAFQRCTWASTIVRLLAGCGRAFCSLVVSTAPATSVVPMNLRRVSMRPSLMPLFGGVSLQDCNLDTAKRNPMRGNRHGGVLATGCFRNALRADASQSIGICRRSRPDNVLQFTWHPALEGLDEKSQNLIISD